jgi:hypothetical protein
MIREEKIDGEEGKYGGIWDYIPLKKIMKLSIRKKDNNLLTLSIQLAEGTQLEYLFRSSIKQEIRRLQYLFDGLAAESEA